MKKAGPMTPEDRVRSGIVIKGRRRVAENGKFDIFLDHIVDGFGREVLDYLVVRPKVARENCLTGVCVLPVVRDRVALVECFRHATGAWAWEATKGFIEDGETSNE